ncbi:FtsX-like permease family protein [uncultured Succinivibrio sp.]|uniref:FtsX-like permease family protein n=1 Tax=uncultured Succinivibrio sp. TaxID=540749 RepID=UPI0025DA3E95|nr:FtsX-like permease family protein [uncultured Succinivibrio sp.]
MRLFHPLTFAIALKYGLNSKAHKFAKFVAILSTVGIAIGVAALIVDTSIMQGLQNRLKKSVLSDTPHLIVETQEDKLPSIMQLNHVLAAAPFVQAQTLMQSQNSLALINLQGLDDTRITYSKGYERKDLNLVAVPERGSFELNAEAALYIRNDLKLNTDVKLISTLNARYTPMGLTPTQRIFTLKKYYSTANSTALDSAVGNYDDIRRFFRMPSKVNSYRIWLTDPFVIDKVTPKIKEMGLNYTDWTSVQGEFFKAVAMEKLTMTIMLCLVIIVASFNIISALAMVVSSRLTEIAIFKTMGLSNLRILNIFLLMGIFVGVIGTAVGIIIGIPLTYYVSDFMSNTGSFGKLPVSIELANILIIGIGSVLMSLLCTLYPAVRAAVTDPVTHLSRG